VTDRSGKNKFPLSGAGAVTSTIYESRIADGNANGIADKSAELAAHSLAISSAIVLAFLVCSNHPVILGFRFVCPLGD
jgi:hypothetical protein